MKSELKTYQLEEIALNICDGVHNTVIDDENGDCLLLSAKNIQNGRIIFDDTDRKINRELCDKLKKRTHLSKNDIAITTVGANVGDLAIIGDGSENYEFQRSVGLIKANTAIADSIYLFYLLGTKSFNYFFHVIATGSAQPCLFLGTLNKIKVTLPALSKQKRIASILSAYDNLIENNNKRIKILEQMAENLYKEWFVRFRFPGHETTPFENGIPKGWNAVSLDSILSKIATGLNPRKNFVLGEGDNYYVTIKNMGDNNIYLDEKCDKVDDEAIIKINNRSDLKQGDLLFSGIGTIGRVYLINIPTNNWNISESVFTMRPNKKVSSEFLYMLLLSDDLQNYCQANANGAAQKGIRMADLKKYTFTLATESIIKDFTSKISPILADVDVIRKSNQNLIKQRDLLLPRLMSGKLSV